METLEYNEKVPKEMWQLPIVSQEQIDLRQLKPYEIASYRVKVKQEPWHTTKPKLGYVAGILDPDTKPQLVVKPTILKDFSMGEPVLIDVDQIAGYKRQDITTSLLRDNLSLLERN